MSERMMWLLVLIASWAFYLSLFTTGHAQDFMTPRDYYERRNPVYRNNYPPPATRRYIQPQYNPYQYQGWRGNNYYWSPRFHPMWRQWQ